MSANDHLSAAQFWHYGTDPMSGDENRYVHLGTREAARNRARDMRANDKVAPGSRFWRVELNQPTTHVNQVPLPEMPRVALDRDDEDLRANELQDMASRHKVDVAAIHYTNEFEDPGSRSVMARRAAFGRVTPAAPLGL